MSAMGIRPGDRVTLHYRLASMGREIVNSFDDAPDTFRIGSGELDSRLEKHLLGLTLGQHTTLHLSPWDAFGEPDETLVQNLPRQDFPQDTPAGHQVSFELPNGMNLMGTIVEVDKDSVKVDFNHPLAGLPIEFEVQILAIEPTPHDQ